MVIDMSFYFTHSGGVVDAFYNSEIVTDIPGVAIEISESQYIEALKAQENGLILSASNAGITPTEYQPTQEELAAFERQWARTELRKTDFIVLPDSPYSDDDKTAVKTYRAALRNPNRMNAPGFPDPSWRPMFPEGVRMPDR